MVIFLVISPAVTELKTVHIVFLVVWIAVGVYLLVVWLVVRINM